jgi:hypothetical protein
LLFAFTAGEAYATNTATDYNTTYAVTRTDTAKLPLDRVIEIHEKLLLDKTIEEAPSVTIDINIPVVKSLNKDISKKLDRTLASMIFEEEESSLDKAVQVFCRNRKEEFVLYINELINDDGDNISDFSGFFYNFFYGITADVESGLNGYINYTATQEVYEGGAHPNSYKSTIIFNPIDGNTVTLDDILKPGYKEALTALLTTKLLEKYNAKTIKEAQEIGLFINETGVPIPSNYTFGNNGIVFIYNTYEIAPYVFGAIHLTLTYDELKDLLKKWKAYSNISLT